MRIVVCGSRNWTDRSKIEAELTLCVPNDIIVHGDARGADTLAGDVAFKRGLRIEAHPANWTRYGRAAGPIRNDEMLDAGCGCVIAFWDGRSKGTAHTIRGALDRNIPTIVVTPTWRAEFNNLTMFNTYLTAIKEWSAP